MKYFNLFQKDSCLDLIDGDSLYVLRLDIFGQCPLEYIGFNLIYIMI